MPLIPLPWNYDKHPNFSDRLLEERAKSALLALQRRLPNELISTIANTRPLHEEYFRDLTPDGHSYFAGHYRGEDFFYLRKYEVQVAGYYGCPAVFVEPKMTTFEEEIKCALAQIDLLQANTQMCLASKLHRIAELSAALFVRFLSIHPYADGNGHMSRFMIVGLFGRAGNWRIKVPVHPRPGPLAPLIAQYRLGNRKPLEHYIMVNL
jgi:hypothetical protein